MLNTGIITQARMTSTRLPGKILLAAGGKTILEHHLDRLAWSLVPVYIATTINSTDQPIVNLARSLGIPHFRSDEYNVLKRYYECAENFKLDVIIRVTSDCPLIDGRIIKEGLEQYLRLGDKNVYYSNSLVRTFPRGLDFEIFSFSQLKAAYLNASIESDKEHVTPYINQNRSQKTVIINHTTNENWSGLRWTLDTEDDWKLIKILLDDYKVASLPYSEILKIVLQHPELTTINNHIKQKI